MLSMQSGIPKTQVFSPIKTSHESHGLAVKNVHETHNEAFRFLSHPVNEKANENNDENQMMIATQFNRSATHLVQTQYTRS